MAKYLRDQGLNGPPYKFFHGNTKEMVMLTTEASSKPMEISHNIVSRVLPFEKQMVEAYGKIFVSWNGSTPRLNVIDPDMIREILSNKFSHFSKLKYSPLDAMFLKGVAGYEGEKWIKHRRILNPTFHQESFKRMLPTFYECCSELVSRWEKLVSEEACEMDVWPYLQELAANVISKTAFGRSYEEGQRVFELQTEMLGHCYELDKYMYIPGFRFLPTKRNRRIKEINMEVRILLTEMIKKREKVMELGEARNDDLLSILINSNLKEIKDGKNSKNCGMSIDDVIQECELFYLAGQDTTSTLLAWTMVVLGMHVEWQQRAREEILQVFGNKEPDFEGLSHLKIVSMILNEVLRLYPPACMLLRTINKTTELGNVVLPPDIEVELPILLVHHDPDLWGDDVEEFNPNRFSEGVSMATKGKVTFFPFGWGPRICIGQTFSLVETKMALAMILPNFSFELSKTYTHAPIAVATLKPQYGIHLILHKI